MRDCELCEEQDRTLILMTGLVPEEGEKIDSLQERHPGVLLGIIATNLCLT